MISQKFLKIALPCTILVTSLIGCGRFNKKDNDDSGGSPVDQVDKNLAGAWENDCEKSDIAGIQYRKVKYKFEVTLGFVRELSVYTDDKCLGERYLDKQVGTWAYLGDAKEAPGARQINFTVNDSYVIPKNSEAAADFNRLKYCGISDWAKGAERKVTDAKCLSAYSKGQVVFDIYKIDNNNLFLGKTGFFLTGKSDGQRPKEIDSSKPHHKK